MITVFTGNNHYAMQRELDVVADMFISTHGDFGLERIDAEEAGIERISEAIQGMPFLSDKKLVILKNPGLHKQFQEVFEAMIPTIPDATDVIIVEPKLDKRSAYYKALKKCTQLKDFSEPDAIALERWAVEYVKLRGGALSLGDARYLIGRIGLGQQSLSSELHKLMAYDPAITKETIDKLTERSPHSTIFDLIDAAMSGQAERALAIYDEQRSMKVEPQQILAMLSWQLHVMAVVKTAGMQPAEQIAKDAKINPYVVKKTAGLVRHIPIERLRHLVQQALKMDIRQKSSSFDLDDALKTYILSIKG